MRGACLVFLAACSSPPPYGGGPFFGCSTTGPLVTITTVDNETLYGSANIDAMQGLDGSGSLRVVVCGLNGKRDYLQVAVFATSIVSPDAQPPAPLPLTSTDEIDLAAAGASVQAVLRDSNVYTSTIVGHLVASQGQLQGSATWGDAGATATFSGGYAFTCATNRPDPDFKTTFCQQFIGLAPP